ncbi:hypothetical protein C453_01190 [Haloferax elongans ATCC BAA-1513]|uniref:Uncharacterized protein n=1 Tax=Haloferax elongans ATCC BAA-1513 TaxID=1230453 RepID=M0HW47_HALEO|nr:hypothetical protein [Haloferax elongans]ELZ88835.1 hypothetical protein C453_01190 [Haloferax elongans ATCC BAA-1513]
MGWLEHQVENAINDVLTDIKDALLGLAKDIFDALLSPIVGVPTPKSNARYIVVGAPDNTPWQSLYSDLYLKYIMPLTFVSLMIGLAYIGISSGSISRYRQKRLLRRVALVGIGTFVWFPLVSVPLQFVDAIGHTIAPINDMSSGFGSLAEASIGGLFAVLIMALVSNVLLLIAALIYAFRWLAIAVLTPLIPILGAIWAFEVWPFTPASNMAKRLAGVYPGLVLAGLPAAVLFRIGWQMDLTADPDGLFMLFMGLALIPAACISSLLTIYWSSPTMRSLAHQTARRSNPAAAAATAKTGVGKSVRGARNVHRGFAQNGRGSLGKGGQAKLGGGQSKAYKLGSSARSAKTHAKRYNTLRKSGSGRMRDKAKSDARRAKELAKKRSKQSLKNTKQKVSRW